MWNYMGWDNASTIATEVERPQRTYPRAMLAAVVIVALSYIVPVAAVWMTGLSPSAWETGSWADIAGLLGGPLLRIGAGPGRHDQRLWHVQRAGDELLAPAAGHGAGRHAAAGVRQAASPHAGALGGDSWSAPSAGRMCLGLGFERLVTIDILLYGASLALEFVALIVLRIREPELAAPVPRSGRNVRRGGGRQSLPCCCWDSRSVRSESEHVLGMSSFAFGMMLIAAGVVAYFLNARLKPAGWTSGAARSLSRPLENSLPRIYTDQHGL